MIRYDTILCVFTGKHSLHLSIFFVSNNKECLRPVTFNNVVIHDYIEVTRDKKSVQHYN